MWVKHNLAVPLEVKQHKPQVAWVVPVGYDSTLLLMSI
jgi:hypothetical protein